MFYLRARLRTWSMVESMDESTARQRTAWQISSTAVSHQHCHSPVAGSCRACLLVAPDALWRESEAKRDALLSSCAWLKPHCQLVADPVQTHSQQCHQHSGSPSACSWWVVCRQSMQGHEPLLRDVWQQTLLSQARGSACAANALCSQDPLRADQHP